MCCFYVSVFHLFTDGEQLVRTNGRQLCVPVKAKPFHRAPCPVGRVPIKGDHGLECAELHHKAEVTCQDGLVPMDTLDGTMCVNPETKKSRIPAMEKGCAYDQVTFLSLLCYFCGFSLY